MMDVRERYLRDAEFHALVDMLEGFIQQLRLTPTEVREAAMLAALHYESRRLPHIRVESIDELRVIRQWPNQDPHR